MDAIHKKRLRQDKKNAARRQFRQDARAAVFVKEYIQQKYPDAYDEACAFYNYINSMYPTKSDLRKTEEFKAMKKGMTFVAKNKDGVVKNPRQVYRSITDLSNENFTIHCYKLPETATETAQTPVDVEIEQSTPVEIQHQAPETTQPATQNNKSQKTMQLRIPLLPPTQITQAPKSVNQEIIEEINEENGLTAICNESIPEDIFNHEIPEETYQAILRDLSLDPDLSKIMDDVELEMGMDIDLPIDDDRLEEELNWEAW